MYCFHLCSNSSVAEIKETVLGVHLVYRLVIICHVELVVNLECLSQSRIIGRKLFLCMLVIGFVQNHGCIGNIVVELLWSIVSLIGSRLWSIVSLIGFHSINVIRSIGPSRSKGRESSKEKVRCCIKRQRAYLISIMRE